MKKEGKGRPVHGYRLSKDFDEIIEEIIQEQTEKIEEIKENINELNHYKSNFAITH